MFIRVITAAVAVAVVGLSTSPADAKVRPVNEGGDSRPCVTYEESLLVNLGMPQRRVQRIVDTPGRRVSGHTLDILHQATHPMLPRRIETRAYPVCAEPDADSDGSGIMLVSFKLDSPRHRTVEAYYERR